MKSSTELIELAEKHLDVSRRYRKLSAQVRCKELGLVPNETIITCKASGRSYLFVEMSSMVHDDYLVRPALARGHFGDIRWANRQEFN